MNFARIRWVRPCFLDRSREIIADQFPRILEMPGRRFAPEEMERRMIAVIFEVWPEEGQTDQYLAMAADMRSLVERIDGFISVERFESLTTPGKLLSISFFRDEAALDEWRRLAEHRRAQDAGRKSLFRNYRLKVARVLRDYGKFDRLEAPADSREMHDST